MKTKFRYRIAVLLVLVIFLGFGFKNKSDTQKYDTISNPSLFNNTEITGAELFQKNCAVCHGADRLGNPPTFPSLANIDKKLNKDEIGSLLTTGRNMMPNFSHLTKSERVAIVGYLYGKNTVSHQITELNSVEMGKNIFVANCVRCHNTTIDDSTQTNQKQWGMQPPYLGGISNKYNETQFKNILNMGPCYMPSFSSLANSDKEDIYAFLNTLEANSSYFNKNLKRGCGMRMR
jgi:mono/diheme cytochrome c family protein